MELVFTSGDAILSPKTLARQIPSLVREYLEQASQENLVSRNGNNYEADLLRLLHEGNFDPSLYIQATRRAINSEDQPCTKGIDWDSELPLTPNALAEICKILCYTVDKFICLDPVKQDPECTEYEASVRSMCNDPGLNTQHGYAIDRFGDFLRHKYLTEVDSPEDIMREELFQATSSYSSVAWGAIEIIHTMNHNIQAQGVDQKLLTQVSNTLFTLVGSLKIEEVNSLGFSRFQIALEEIINDIKNRDSESCEILQNCLTKIINLITQNYPHAINKKNQEPLLLPAIINDPEKPLLLLKPNHLFFTYPRESTPVDEQLSFPKSAFLILGRSNPARRVISSNVSVFDSQGVKVFWGDLSHHHINENLQGPYYVLAQGPSYWDVPDWAMIQDTGKAAEDPYRPAQSLMDIPGESDENWYTGATFVKQNDDRELPVDKIKLDLGYIRLNAIGIIHKGKYVELDKSGALSN
jgi:hypothetical protein